MIGQEGEGQEQTDKNTAFATQKQLCFIKCTQQHITKRKLKNRRREEMLQSMKRKKTTILRSWLQVLRFNNWERTDIAHEQNKTV